MYYVYILFSLKDNKLYIGYTNNLKIRLIKHQRGFVKSTQTRRPLRLIYYKCYLSKKDAQKREIFLKGGKGHNELKIQLEETYRIINY